MAAAGEKIRHQSGEVAGDGVHARRILGAGKEGRRDQMFCRARIVAIFAASCAAFIMTAD
jgi:hypothetical protein